ELSFATVTALFSEYAQLNTQAPQIIDLQTVTHTDSAGIALLIELLKQHPGLSFRHIPPQLLRIAHVYGVEALLTETAQ
ncbi:MAG: STAS domain-containing protein, partial [Pseudomonadota bacterium]|nr:STAS domain-containing protein [Pseudomonadota bacterium]